MRKLLLAIISAVLGAAAVMAQQPPAAAPPPPPAVKVGDPMPDFTLPYLMTQDGKVARREVTLSSFKGQKNVVLAFFPAAFSPG
jgi:hypothetical protein